MEALIDLRIAPASGFSVEDLAVIWEMVADKYPTREEEHVQYQQMSFVGTELMQSGGGHQLNGFRFVSGDQRETFYARLDGFAFSIRAPYDRWESFRDEARGLWDLYRSVAMPEGVTRSAMRYINRIDIPNATAGVRLEDYLRTHPEISADFPEDGLMSNFFMQVQIWQQDLGCWLIVNEAPEPSPEEGTLSVRLDLDLFREQYEEPWPVYDDTTVWELLERLHDRKNEVFEASITNRTGRLIKWPPRLLLRQSHPDAMPTTVSYGFHPGIGDGEPTSSIHKNFRNPLWRTISEIIALLSWPEDWNGYGATAPNSESVGHALMWIEALYKDTLTTDKRWMAPHVVLDADGNVVLEWWNDQRKLTIYARPGSVEYVKVWGPDIFSDMEYGEIEGAEDRRKLWNWLTG